MLGPQSKNEWCSELNRFEIGGTQTGDYMQRIAGERQAAKKLPEGKNSSEEDRKELIFPYSTKHIQ